jgi:hypothetical protein
VNEGAKEGEPRDDEKARDDEKEAGMTKRRLDLKDCQ